MFILWELPVTPPPPTPSAGRSTCEGPLVKYGVRSSKFIWAPCHVMWTAVLIGWDPTTLTPPSSRIWTLIRGRYWSAKIDDISLKTPCPSPTVLWASKRCRLSLLTNSAQVYESKCGGMGLLGLSSANEYSCAHHVTWGPNKLWRYTSIFNLWFLSSTAMSHILLYIHCTVPSREIYSVL